MIGPVIMPKRPDVPEQQQLGNYTPPKSPTQRDDDSIAPTVPASEHDLDGQAQQTQDQDRDRNITEDSDEARQFALVKKAVADVKPTARYVVTGTVTFSPGSDSKSMNIQIALSGLTPGQHGLHIHQNGSCSSDDAASAGPRFNPYQMPHGAPQVQSHHAGDLGNVEADAEGRVNTTLTMPDTCFLRTDIGPG